MRVLIAARLSQKHDGQTGIDTQDLASREWAERHGHTVVAMVADKKSGTVPPWERPNLKPWVTDPRLIAQYDGIMAWRFDRLSRGAKADTNAIETWAHKHGKVMLTEDGLEFPAEGAAGIRWDVTARIAHEEWRKTSERYLSMQKYLTDSGYLVGKVPFGFRIVAADETGHKTVVPDEREADAIRNVAEMLLSGQSLAGACRWLDGQGLLPHQKNSREWHPKVLASLLRNELLIGRRVNGKGQTVLKTDPILDRATWRDLQAHLDERGHRKGIAPSETAMLTGIAVCGKCGGPMYRVNSRTTRKDGSKYDQIYYRCHGTAKDASTCRNMVRTDALEGWLDAEMRSQASYVIETAIVPGDDHAAEIEDVERDLRELSWDDPRFTERQAALLAERARFKGMPATPEKVEERVASYTVADLWDMLDPAMRRRYLLDSGVKVRVDGKDPAGWQIDGDPAEVAQFGWRELMTEAAA